MIRAWAMAGVLAAVLIGVPAEARSAKPGDAIPGPLEAEVLRVIDGDTFVAKVWIWPGQTVVTKVRLDGVDTPEKHGKCSRERMLAEAAGRRLQDMLTLGALIRDVRWGKFAGRVVARVYSAGGTDVAEVLIKEGLARRYSGDGPRKPWC